MDSPAGFPQLPPEGSPSLRRQKPDARNQTFGKSSHVLGPKLTCWGNFLMVLHGFASRSPKALFSSKIWKYQKQKKQQTNHLYHNSRKLKKFKFHIVSKLCVQRIPKTIPKSTCLPPPSLIFRRNAENSDFGHVRTYSSLHKLRNTQGKIHGTYLGNMYGIYK